MSKPKAGFRAVLRRAISIPLLLVMTAAIVLSSPALLPALALADWVNGRTQLARTFALVMVYCVCECLAVGGAFATALAYPFLGLDRESREDRFERAHVALQSWWTRTLLRIGMRIFRIRMEVEGEDAVAAGPMVLLMRHSSIGDTVLPSLLVTQRHGIRLRYVLKKELLWDPALDLVGHRIPNYFVDRSARDPRREIEGVRRLVQDLRPDEGVIIYPEGTVYDEGRKRAALARIAARGDSDAHARASRLAHVLPPRIGGTLALLEANPGLDLVFGAHVGFEGAVGFTTLSNGAWLDSVIRVRFYRVPHAELPREREELAEFLWDAWERMDREVGALHARRV